MKPINRLDVNGRFSSVDRVDVWLIQPHSERLVVAPIVISIKNDHPVIGCQLPADFLDIVGPKNQDLWYV